MDSKLHRLYYAPRGGLPAQAELLTDRAMFTEAYAVIPRRTMRDTSPATCRISSTRACGCWPGRCPASPKPSRSTSSNWVTSRFVDPEDLRHDMHVNIVTLHPGTAIPFAETHVMEHGLYVLEGKAVYPLNQDWVEVEAGDFMWLRAFCPQACYAGGPGVFRYLLYKDVNRHAPLTRPV
jgi:glyoxylate utilization-related uncharacterized protein